MITPNTAIAVCTIVNIGLTVINFILAVNLNRAINNPEAELEAEIEEDTENE